MSRPAEEACGGPDSLPPLNILYCLTCMKMLQILSVFVLSFYVSESIVCFEIILGPVAVAFFAPRIHLFLHLPV